MEVKLSELNTNYRKDVTREYGSNLIFLWKISHISFFKIIDYGNTESFNKIGMKGIYPFRTRRRIQRTRIYFNT